MCAIIIVVRMKMFSWLSSMLLVWECCVCSICHEWYCVLTSMHLMHTIENREHFVSAYFQPLSLWMHKRSFTFSCTIQQRWNKYAYRLHRRVVDSSRRLLSRPRMDFVYALRRRKSAIIRSMCIGMSQASISVHFKCVLSPTITNNHRRAVMAAQIRSTNRRHQNDVIQKSHHHHHY